MKAVRTIQIKLLQIHTVAQSAGQPHQAASVHAQNLEILEVADAIGNGLVRILFYPELLYVGQFP